MKTSIWIKIIFAIIASLLILGAAFVILTTDFDDAKERYQNSEITKITAHE